METNRKIEKKIASDIDKFHSVEFMRKVRSELTQKFFRDKQEYRDFLKGAMEEFKLRQKKAHS